MYNFDYMKNLLFVNTFFFFTAKRQIDIFRFFLKTVIFYWEM